jgi:hypothetical protein
MRTSLILGAALATIGIVLFLVGLSSAQAPTEQVQETLTGRYSGATRVYLALGALLFLAGGIVAARGAGRR